MPEQRRNVRAICEECWLVITPHVIREHVATGASNLVTIFQCGAHMDALAIIYIEDEGRVFRGRKYGAGYSGNPIVQDVRPEPIPYADRVRVKHVRTPEPRSKYNVCICCLKAVRALPGLWRTDYTCPSCLTSPVLFRRRALSKDRVFLANGEGGRTYAVPHYHEDTTGRQSRRDSHSPR